MIDGQFFLSEILPKKKSDAFVILEKTKPIWFIQKSQT